MAMVINTNEQSTRIHSIYNKNIGQMNAAMTRIATAQKINSAKDGAANWAISEKMRERIRANDQANQNIQNDTALLKTAQGGFGNTLDVLQTLKERAINAANDANVSSDRTKIQEEVKQLVAQIDDNANKVKFNGRQLLNGASETAATASTASSTSTATAVTATDPQGNRSVYSITGLKVYDTTNNEYRYVGDTSAHAISDVGAAGTGIYLKDLRDANGNELFKNGDTISVSWRDNGELKQASLTVVADKTTETNSTLLSAMTALFNTSGASSFSGSALKNSGVAIDSSNVTDPEGNDVTTTNPGIYIVAKDSQRKITDLAISVTRDDGADSERLANTQAVLQPNAVLQNASSDGFTTGSNHVYGLDGATAGTLVQGDAGDKTRWMDLRTGGSAGSNTATHYMYDTRAASPTTTATTEITMNINGTAVKFKAGSTIAEVNQLLKDKGIDVRMHIANAGEILTYDDETVTKGDATSNVGFKAASAGLYFISAEGNPISSLKITGGTGGNSSYVIADGATNKLDLSASSSGFVSKLTINNDFLSYNSTASNNYASTDSMLPQGDALQFYVGGEQNFGIDFTIGKATVQNLFNMSGDKFASMFKDKEGAEEALTYIDDAINKTLVEQTRLGAMEARLGYTSENLTSMNTNLESAQSAYRDADLAKEMTTYMKYSVLAQSSQYMLAQATQNPFSVLQLLQP